MLNNVSEFIICSIFLFSLIVLSIINILVKEYKILNDSDVAYKWITNGFKNLLGYSTVLLPGYLVYKYITKTSYLSKCGGGVIRKAIQKFFGESVVIASEVPTKVISEFKSSVHNILLCCFYFIGYQASFLTCGYLQEKIMTQNYQNAYTEDTFKDSQFLVFVNRIISFIFSIIVLYLTEQPQHNCPLYKYVFCSLSNITSSWSLYECLKFISYPTLVLAKSCKPIPVMAMSKIISKTKYKFHEYFTIAIIVTGVIIFTIDSKKIDSSTSTTFAGIILLCIFIVLDAFTSTWQGKLFKQYKMTPVQMMCSINLFSSVFTIVSLLQQGSFIRSIKFMISFPSFILDCFLLSICSASGQLFIFNIISSYGPLVFALFATTRQSFSVLLSCLIFKHELSIISICGVIIVFSGIILRITFISYCKSKQSTNTNK